MPLNDYEFLSFERPRPGVLLVLLDRPDRLNATNEPMHTELARVWRDVTDDPESRAVVVAGRGTTFCAGGDLGMIERQVDNFDLVRRAMGEAADIVRGILDCPKPVVSAVQGAAMGAGLAVALLADISIVAEDARIGDGHVRLGIAAGDHAVLLWPLLCGMAKAKLLLMTGDMLDGREAERIGLVSRCLPSDDVVPAALDLAERLATGSPTALQWTKSTLNHWYKSLLPAFDASLALEMLGFFGDDVHEGLAALAEKRRPRFDQA